MLQRLKPHSISPEALQLIAHGLPDLRTLTINLKPDWVDETDVYDWPLARESLAACHQLIDLTLVETPLEQISALLLALPLSVRKLDIRDCEGFLQSDAVFQCVAEGGLRQLEQLHIRLRFEEDEDNSVIMASWLTRQRACAPWIHALVREA
jgi:hypothetical protein